jgi:hypothetical protein
MYPSASEIVYQILHSTSSLIYEALPKTHSLGYVLGKAFSKNDRVDVLPAHGGDQSDHRNPSPKP